MKGIRKTLLSVLALNLLLGHMAFGDEIQDALVRCVDDGGNLIEGPASLNADGTQSCREVICYKATGNVSSLDFNDIKNAIDNTPGDRGAAQAVWDKNICVAVRSATEDIEAEVARRRADRAEAERRRREEAEREQRNRDRVSQDNQNQNRDSGSRTVRVGVDGGGDWGGWDDGDRIRVGGKTYIVGSDAWYKKCVNKSGSDKGTIRSKCLRSGGARLVISGGGGYDDGDRGGVFDGEVTFPRGGSGGGVYIVQYRDGRTFECSNSMSMERCLRDRYGIINYRVGDARLCSDCSVRGGGSTNLVIQSNRNSGNSWGGILSGVAELAGAVAPPLFGYLGVKAQANAYQNVGTAFANAQATGYEQCALLQQNYVEATYQHINQNELPDREVDLPGCNGFGLGQFAGGGGQYGNGFGGFGNPYYSGGFSPGFVGGMYGPGAGFNLGINANSGLYNPYAGLGGGGFGVGIGGGIGLPGFGGGGFGGGPGFGGGINTGFNTGGSVQCITFPCPGMGGGGFGGGGFGGFPGAGGGGFGGGINIGIGAGGGFPGGGGFGSGYGVPGYGGGFGGGHGSIGIGTVPWGQNTGGYWGNNGGFTGGGGFGHGRPGYGYNNGGSINGNQFFSVQAAHQQNYAAAGAGNYYQQAALQNQMRGAAQNSANYAGGGFGGYNPGFAPMNAGFQLNGGFGFGF